MADYMDVSAGIHAHVDLSLVDQTIDASVVAIRAEDNLRRYQDAINKVVDGPKQPLASPNNPNMYNNQVPPQQMGYVPPSSAQPMMIMPMNVSSSSQVSQQPNQHQSQPSQTQSQQQTPQNIEEEKKKQAAEEDEKKRKEEELKKQSQGPRFISDKVIYNSMQRSPLYYATAWLWCGCFEPKYKITAEYVVGEEWKGCVRVTDSMPYELVNDVTRSQPCCYAMLSCCCPCIHDMGNIILLGADDSHREGWVLKRIHRSQKVYDILVKTVQAANTNFKKKAPEEKKH
jgi:hypothetical protein